MRSETRYILMGAAIVLVLGVVLYYLPGTTEAWLGKLKVATGFTLLALIFLFGFAVLVNIANGNIDLGDLLSEQGDSKGASMSRFQLLIFTLVIAFSLFLVVISNMAFPKSIPPEILTLLGISASTYAVSKGIQISGSETTTTTQAPNATVTTTTPANPAAPTTVTNTEVVTPGAGPSQTTTTTLPTGGPGA